MSTARKAAAVAAVAVAYFVFAKLGVLLAVGQWDVSPVWPASGVALAALLLFGRGVWPGIAIGALLEPLTTPGVPAIESFGVAAGNTVGPLLAAWLLTRSGKFRNGLGRVADVMAFLLWGALAGPFLSAAIGMTSACLLGHLPWSEFSSLGVLWFLGDAMGTLLVTPVLLTWGTRDESEGRFPRPVEGIVLVASLAAVSLVVFGEGTFLPGQNNELVFAVFPFLVWAALRFGPREASTAVLLVSALAVFTTMNRIGPFAKTSLEAELVSLHAYLAVAAGTALYLSASLAERRESARNLGESEERYRRLVDLAPDAIAVHQDGRLVFVNPAAVAICGFGTPEEMIGRPVLDFVESEFHEVVKARIAGLLSGEAEVGLAAMEFRRKDGTSVPVEGVALRTVHAGRPAIQVVYRDVTAKNRAEEAMRAARANLEAVVENTRDEIWSLDRDLKLVTFNSVFREDHLRDFGIDVAPGQPFEERVPRGRREPWLSFYRRTLAGERFTAEVAWPPGDPERTFEYSFNPICTEGRVTGVSAFGKDVTERKRAEKALRESEELYRVLAEHSTDLITTHAPDGRIFYVSPVCRVLLGYEPEELTGQSVFDYLHPDDVAAVRASYVPVLKRALSTTSTYRVRRKDGRNVWFESSGRAIRDPATGSLREILVVSRDVTERMRTEEERRSEEVRTHHSQKLESLGVLAGGIAHDFNNLLVGILGNASFAAMELPPLSPVRQAVQQIELAARRAADLTRQMLAYSGKGRFHVQALNLSSVVREMAELLASAISKKAVLTLDFAPDLPAIEADPAQIRQVVMNLITNASDALGDRGGTITLKTGLVEADRAMLDSAFVKEDVPEGAYVFLEVSDSGDGMDPQTAKRIFDPFFTTKFTGRGLGLAAVLGIVRGHQGTIHVESEPGKGTRFRVLLPARALAPVPEAEPAPRAPRPLPVSGTILVVDDEEGVRNVTRSFLLSQGFDVLTAADGREGVDLFRREAAGCSAVLLDLTMPKLSGEEAFEEIRRIRPDVPVILMSGYSEQEVAFRFGRSGPSGFLQKPFSVSDVIAALERVL